VQSQAYARHFGPTAKISETIFALLDEVTADPSLKLDVFAYDLDEPDVLKKLLALAGGGRVRVTLDDSAEHHSTKKSEPEEEFQAEFEKVATGEAGIERAKFSRFAHDKIMVVSGAAGPTKVLSGSTNFSVSGLYVNANHVLVFNDAATATKYGELFQQVWEDGVSEAKFVESAFSAEAFARPVRRRRGRSTSPPIPRRGRPRSSAGSPPASRPKARPRAPRRACSSRSWRCRGRARSTRRSRASGSATRSTMVDHFDFLDRLSSKGADPEQPPASKREAAVEAGWFLATSDAWSAPYFDPDDLHCVDRELFAAPLSYRDGRAAEDRFEAGQRLEAHPLDPSAHRNAPIPVSVSPITSAWTSAVPS
jgi:hypothetical protein